jgi:hypothetical protein
MHIWHLLIITTKHFGKATFRTPCTLNCIIYLFIFMGLIHTVRLFENRLLKRVEVTEDWRNLRSDDHNSYFSREDDKIKEDEIGGSYSTDMGDEKFIQNFNVFLPSTPTYSQVVSSIQTYQRTCTSEHVCLQHKNKPLFVVLNSKRHPNHPRNHSQLKLCAISYEII